VLVAKCALKHRYSRYWWDRTAGPVQSGNWYSKLAQRVRDTELYSTGTNTIGTADWHSTCVTQNCTSLAQIQLVQQTGTARARHRLYSTGTNTIGTADWHSVCVTQNCTALAQIQMIHIVGENCFVTHCYSL
jgi:hypothetical protein